MKIFLWLDLILLGILLTLFRKHLNIGGVAYPNMSPITIKIPLIMRTFVKFNFSSAGGSTPCSFITKTVTLKSFKMLNIFYHSFFSQFFQLWEKTLKYCCCKIIKLKKVKKNDARIYQFSRFVYLRNSQFYWHHLILHRFYLNFWKIQSSKLCRAWFYHPNRLVANLKLIV